MAFIRQLPYDLVAAPEIKRVEDLRGKKVAVADRGSVTFFVARSILQGHGLEPDRDVTMEAVIADTRDVTGIKRTVRADEIFDFRLLQRVNEEWQGWRP